MTRFLLTLMAGAVVARGADVVVYGATPAGIAAAVVAARAGHSVMLLEPSARPGGMLTGGLSNTDFRTLESVSGFFREYMGEVLAYYSKTYGPDSEQVKICFFGARAEPKVSLAVLQAMIGREKSLTLKLGWRMSGVETESGPGGMVRVRRMVGGAGERIEARAFVDATYEGDLSAAAGVEYRVGRESAKEYGERFAGRLFMRGGAILPGSTGEGDRRVQSYNFRVTMTDDPALRLPVAKPPVYRREEYTGAIEPFRSGALPKAFTEARDGALLVVRLPNSKWDVNDIKISPLRLTLAGEVDQWPEGTWAERARILERHRNYALGAIWFLQNDGEVPAAIRQAARAWGLPKDEFTDSGHFPPALYVREGRRIVGDYVFTEHDTQPHTGVRAPLHSDAIATGDYGLNSHGHGRPGALHPGVGDGDLSHITVPFQVPYGAIVPKKVENLLVPVAFSASHVGYSAVRLEPTWTLLGHAAGLAAHLSLARGVPVQRVPVEALQQRLLAQKVVLIYAWDVAPESPDFLAVQRLGLRGFLHDIAAVHPEPLGTLKQRSEQYAWPFPHHAAGLGKVLDAELRRRWMARLPEEERGRLSRLAAGATRGEFLEAAREGLRGLWAVP